MLEPQCFLEFPEASDVHTPSINAHKLTMATNVLLGEFLAAGFICVCSKCTSWHIGDRFSPSRSSFLTLSAAGRAGGPAACTLGTSLGPGWAPGHVLWAFKIARAGK